MTEFEVATKAVLPDPTVKLSEKAKQLLNAIPQDGSHIGNTSLRSSLNWGEEYWDIRQQLLDNGLIVVGRGRGGSVARTTVAPGFEVTAKATLAGLLVKDEFDLYEPLRKWLKSDWGGAAEADGDYYWVEVTASPSGRKRESGKWSRPDLTFVQVSTYELIPKPTVEVTSFEVKRYNEALDLSNVYEAASHSRWTHYSYLVIEDTKSKPLEPEPRFLRELSRFGVGL